MDKALKLSRLVIASYLLLGAQQGVQMVIMAGPPSGAPLNPCIVAAYPMTEGSGLTLHDSSVNNNTATLAASGHTWQSNSGLPGTTLLFTNPAGILGAVAASATPTSFSNTQAFSVSFWSLASTSAAQFWLSTRNISGGTNVGWGILQAANGLLEFSIVGTGGGNILIQNPASNPFTAGVVHLFAVTYDGSSTAAGAKIYVDGTATPLQVNANSLVASSASTVPLNFGQENDGSNKLNSTSLAFVEVYNCAVTQPFLASSFAGGPGIY